MKVASVLLFSPHATPSLLLHRTPPAAQVTMPNNPVDESMGEHDVPLCNVIYIERDDFTENPPKGM